MSTDPRGAKYYYDLGHGFHSQGNLNEALSNYRKALALNPGYVEAHVGVGAISHVQGRFEEAAGSYRKALEIKPDYAEAHYNLGNALREQGDLDGAIASYRMAISSRPGFADACNNLGIALQNQGRAGEALDRYREAISLQPDHLMACLNLAALLQQQGRHDEAIDRFRQALSIKPDFAEAHNNLGVSLHAKGQLSEAAAAYRRAVSFNPGYAQAHDNLGTALHAMGQIDAALASYRRALELGDAPAFKANFVRCIRNYAFVQDAADIRALVLRGISEHWSWQSELTRPGISLLRCDRTTNDCIERTVLAWPKRLGGSELFGPAGLAGVAGDPLLRALLESGPVCDIAMERFLTMARRVLLETAMEAGIAEDHASESLAFRCALARQCFTNEYVYSPDDAEAGLASLLRERLVTALGSGEAIPATTVAAVAAYWPLSSIPKAEALLERQWPGPVMALLAQQVAEPLEERRYRDAIPRLTNVAANVSTSVRQQYEENPYPRWLHAPPADAPVPIDVFLGRQFPEAAFTPLQKAGAIDILIAGCGTGLEPILRARQIADARLLAIDLSLTSICYAKRKTRELGLTSIEYAQADITKLQSLGRTFDIVESAGVLHHLADPLAGMRVLMPLLRPGGFMFLGLYSEYAREKVVEAKAIIAKRGYASTDESIRRCRQELLLEKAGSQFEPLTSIRDFYVMSECRDLLFHVQEHRFTLPQIKEMLAEFGLNFIGFSSLDHSVIREYEARFTDDPAHVNLDYWGYFETEFPSTFVQMYQFWVQKPA